MSKKKTGVGKVLQSIGKGIKGAVDKGKAVAEDVPYAPLLPFEKSMKILLDKRGIKHTNSLHDVSSKFVKLISGSHFTHGMNEGEVVVYADQSNLVDDAVYIIQQVISFFKDLSKKKNDNPASLTSEEKQILAPAETNASTVVAAAEKPNYSAMIIEFFQTDAGKGLLLLIAIIVFAVGYHYFF